MIFLSYSRKDMKTMQRIKRAIEFFDAEVWTDEKLKQGTRNWFREIDSNLRKSDAVVVLMSPSAYDSKWVDAECGKAEAYEKEIFPILIEGEPKDVVPLSLWSYQRIDMHQHFDKGVGELIANFQQRGYCRAYSPTQKKSIASIINKSSEQMDLHSPLPLWRVIPPEGSQLVVQDDKNNPNWKDIVSKHVAVLSISEPYYYELYKLPGRISFPEVEAYYSFEMAKREFQQTRSELGANDIYLLKYQYSLDNKSKVIALFYSELANRDPMVLVFYSNPVK